MRILLCLLLVLTFAGCATTRAKGDHEQLQGRVVELEKKLEEKDAEIVDLQYEVKDLSSKVESKSDSASPVVSNVPESVVVAKGGDEVLRVNTTPEKVQSALKAAGFYTGKVDGKLGSGTKAAIVAFQKSKGLRADGVIGRKTWDALKQFLK